jgi:predicted transcriptional regulator
MPTSEVKPTSIYLDTDTLQDLKQIAKTQERSISWVVRKAIKEYIAKSSQ